LSPWDHAAAGLIAQESGATVEGWNGQPASKEFAIAGQESVVRELYRRLLAFDI
jgi:myo-inositol-1(or 4)-monophosphatase